MSIRLHSPVGRNFAIREGSVMTEGGSLTLAKGQVGIFDSEKSDRNGLKAVSSFKGQPKNKYYEIRVGNGTGLTRTDSNKAKSSIPFRLADIRGLRVGTPNIVEPIVDEVILGYNGIDDSTALKMDFSGRQDFVLKMSGLPIGLAGYTGTEVEVPFFLDVTDLGRDLSGCKGNLANCSDLEDVFKGDINKMAIASIERLKNQNLLAYNRKVSDVVDVSIIRKCGTSPAYNEVAHKFYCLQVCDTGDDNALALVQSQYPGVEIVRVERKGAVSKYQFVQLGTLPAPGGFKQTVASVMKDCKPCGAGTTETKGGFLYSIVNSDLGADNSSDIETLANKVDGTVERFDYQHGTEGTYTILLSKKLSEQDLATFLNAEPTSIVTYLGEIASVCKDATITTINWVECGECKVADAEFTIDLPDTKCGESRLAELKMAYPYLTIEEEGTQGGCQRRYKTKTITNMVCDECDPIFKAHYQSYKPAPYDNRSWKEVPLANDFKNCKIGIRFKAKVFKHYPPDHFKDTGFIEDSVRIQVSGGFSQTSHLFGDLSRNNPAHVEYVTRKVDRTHVGGNAWDFERRGDAYFDRSVAHEDAFTRALLGETSVFPADARLVNYTLTVSHQKYSNSLGARHEENIDYVFITELGRHEQLEDLLNELAVSAGVSPVKAFGTKS